MKDKKIFQQNCMSWGKNACKSKDLKELHKKKIEDGKKFNWPEGTELDKYNKICKECDHPLEIKEDKCPACESYPASLIGSPFHQKRKVNSIPRYRYRCDKCGRELASTKKFF